MTKEALILSITFLFSTHAYAFTINDTPLSDPKEKSTLSTINNASSSAVKILLSNGENFDIKSGSGKAFPCSEINNVTLSASTVNKTQYDIIKLMSCGHIYIIGDAK